MDSTQRSSRISSSRTLNKKRHLCYCGEAVVVLSSSEVASHGRRYVACGRVPRCSFFEWIDNEDDMKGEWLKQKERRSRCFCGDSLILKSSNTPKNPNRRFMSCPSRRCKFFEWVDEEKKVRDACLLSSQYHSGQVEGEIRGENAQERRVDSIVVRTEPVIEPVRLLGHWVTGSTGESLVEPFNPVLYK
ncbi:hypothetical protein AHAS_Ahas14G0050700 [Arachis hypogaea]